MGLCWNNYLKKKLSLKNEESSGRQPKVKNINLNNNNNNNNYNIFKKQVLEKPYIHAFWSNSFDVDINWSVLYHSFLFSCPDHRIKAFKYKLIHNIIPTRENLHKWRILDSPECLHCNTKDNYLHFLYRLSVYICFGIHAQTLSKHVVYNTTCEILNTLF